MQLDTDLTGLFGITLAIVALLARLPRVKALPMPRRAGVLGAAIVVVSIPLWGVTAAGFVRGMTGDLSISTLVLLALGVVRSFSGRAMFADQDRHAMLRAVLIAAVLFYPLALGLGMFDPYRLGYGNLWFMAVLLGLAVWSGLRYSMLLALCVALAVAAWSAGWYESPNLWDYLLDPWLAVYALGVQLRTGLSRWRGNKHA
ncbi:hypothetical protein GALL_88490 [mine drainage metagenome]|uniref:Uncharacterized protein n=1 Tax=mine drainage metagenome TaxID=410659 RepID=A0A1J5SK94_9ZZZZ